MNGLSTELGGRLAGTLTSVFGRPPIFISDSPALVEWLKSVGCHASEFKDAYDLRVKERKNVVALLTNTATIPQYKEWQTLFRNSRVLIVPLAAFDASMEATTYTIELLARSDFEAAASANQRWLSLLLERKAPLIFSGQGCDLVCELRDEVALMKPNTEARLFPGEWDSIGAYFEVGMIPLPGDVQDFRSGVVNGTLGVPGIAVARHRRRYEELGPHHRRAWELFQELRGQGQFPLKVSIENSQVVHVFAGEKDISSELAELTNDRELVVTEMAVSTNEGILPEHIDWTKNSQMNEGAIGIHIGIGDGLTGIHIDFICPSVELKTGREAVGVGDLSQIENTAAVLGALNRAGAADLIGALPAGLGTQLGQTWADGIDLSQGQWQKVALGRAMMRKAPLLLVLDEPTASLDAETEHVLFERYADAARQNAESTGTITLLISHRFSTVYMADLIVVLSRGRIVETGSHKELIAFGGLYADLYELQARMYR